jgi:hypothetical protein
LRLDFQAAPTGAMGASHDRDADSPSATDRQMKTAALVPARNSKKY